MLLFHMQPQDQNNYGLLILANMLRQDKEDCSGGNTQFCKIAFFFCHVTLRFGLKHR